MAAEIVPYTVSAREGAIERRDYPALIVAEVTVTGSRAEAANTAFRPLADYIFGNNLRRDRIAMTAPVTQTPVEAEGARIAMTSPVTQTPAAEADSWVVRFIMPTEWTMDTLPAPRNPAVRLIEAPAHSVVAIRFSGTASPREIDRREGELRGWMQAQGLAPAGPPTYAFYDPPWTPSFLRRNEVLVPVAAPVPAGG